MNENLVGISIPTIVSVGIILLIWAVVLVIGGQIFRRVAASQGGS